MSRRKMKLHIAQRDVIIDQLLDTKSAQYNIGGYIKLKGNLNLLKFAETVNSVPHVFDAYKMRFDVTSGAPNCYIDYEYELLEFDTLDFSSMANPEASAQHWMQERYNIAFDLNQDTRLFEHSLLKISNQEHWFYGRYHHLITDGYGFMVFVQYLSQKYKSLISGEAVNISYPSYLHEATQSADYFESHQYQVDKEYWENKIAEKPSRFFQPNPSLHNDNSQLSATETFVIQPNQLKLLQSIQNSLQSGLQHLTIAALLIYLCKLSGNNAFVFGIPLHKRNSRKLRNMVGMFSGILPFKAVFQQSQTVSELVESIVRNLKSDYRHQNYPIGELSRFLKVNPLEGYLHEITVNYEPLGFELDFGNNVQANIFRLANEDDRNPLQINWRDYGNNQALELQIHYRQDYFEKKDIEDLVSRLFNLFEQFSKNNNTQVGDLDLLTSEEQHQLLVEFNQTSAVYPKDQTIVDLFEQQVKSTPNQTALVYEDQTLSYQELNEKANQLAHYLRAEGVKPETRVAICLDRGFEMLVGILGILKSGGAYVPIDPQYPVERIKFMLEDCSATIVVSTSAQSALFQEHQAIKQTELDQLDLSKYPKTNPDKVSEQSHLAYIIYTSGSTGKPKGVMIEHGNVYSFIDWCKREFNAQSFEMVYAGTSMCFDLSVYEFFYPLSIGKTIRVLENGLEIGKYIKTDQQVLTNSVPSVIESLLKQQTDFSNAKVINMAGEPISDYVQQTLDTQTIEVRNLYGPSEDTTYSTVYRLSPQTSLKIGKPIANTKVYILSPTQDLLPIGVKGEIYLGGAGLARGYLNNEALTQEKFIPNPFDKTERLYRTGDIGRWLKDGNIEYLGRVDDQIKIRGYRIELGEIETAIAQIKTISQSVVVAQTEPSGAKRLVAYVVAKNQFDKSQVIEKLKQSLPEYMIPPLWIALDSLPLTANGKIDKKALPKPDMDAELKQHYQAAESKTEQDLVKIWEELLGISPIGTRANFFELGGDSILTIQVVSRASRMGYSLQPKDIFTHQTISSLAQVLAQKSQSEIKAEQGKLQGELGLIPIQSWYLETAKEHVSHFNQSVLLTIDKQITPEQLEQSLELIIAQHDSLRLQFIKTEQGYRQSYGSSKSSLQIEDLHKTSKEQLTQAIEALSQSYQESLDITQGDISRFVLIRTPESELQNRLLMVVHHLAIDGVSWRIIIEDLEQILEALIQNQRPKLETKSSSYRQWYHTLESYSQTAQVQSSLGYWQKTVESYESLLGDKPIKRPSLEKDIRVYQSQLNIPHTEQLVRQSSKAYHTEINDLLLAALAQTLADYSQTTRVSIGMEGHGREAIDSQTDTSRTTGWFTSLYPVSLKLDEEHDPSALIKSTKEQLRKIPEKGLSYGVLKYLTKLPDLQSKDPWDIVFNYLGQLDTATGKQSLIQVAKESTGKGKSGEQELKERLSVDCRIQNKQLEINWSYDSQAFSSQKIEQLSAAYLLNLESLIVHCISQSRPTSTPSDYGLLEIDYRDLDVFLKEEYNGKPRRERIESMYRLSGLQQGMLFHNLYDNESGAYIEQLSADLTDLNTTFFIKSWENVIKKHSSLRSIYYADALEIPVQCVSKTFEIPVQIFDFRNDSLEIQNQKIRKLEAEDLQIPFDLQQAPLMRFALIRLSDKITRMLWTSHHLLFDGWSLPIIMEQFMRGYESLSQGIAIPIESVDRFEDYIHYVESIDKHEADTYWQSYLDGLDEATLLPFVSANRDRNKGVGTYNTTFLELSSEKSVEIRNFAKNNRLTVNTLIQGVWSQVLHRYTGKDDIAFGVIVSGRPGCNTRY
jgi:amino acid adenylation domain-containing protein/non-ribosomal peptide synthase protein (TIGR01720 family)